jgi:hypothetical protein
MDHKINEDISKELKTESILDWSQDSSVGIGTDWTAQVRFLAVQDFSLLHSVQTGPSSLLSSGCQGLFPQG